MDGWKRSELALVFTAGLLVFSRVFGLSLVLPNFRQHFGDYGTPVMVGFAFGAYGLTMALMQLPAGILSDRVGRKPLLIASSVLFVAGSVLAAFSTSMGPLVAGRLLQGLGAISSVAMAAVGETLPDERRTTGMAMIGIPAGLGFFVGVGAGPGLYPVFGMQGLFLLTAAVGLIPLLALPFLAFSTPVAAPATTSRPVLALASAGFVSSFFLTTTLFFLPTTEARQLLPMLALALLAVGGIGRVVDRRGWTWQPIAAGLMGLAVAAPVFVLATGAWLFVGGSLFFLAHATLATTLPSQVSRLAGASGGRGHGIQNVIAYTGTFVAGPVAGFFAARAGLDFALGAVLALATIIAVRWSLGRPQPSNVL